MIVFRLLINLLLIKRLTENSNSTLDGSLYSSALPEGCEHFKPVDGDWQTASVVLMGGFPLENIATAQCTEALTQDKGEHVVLVESVPSGVAIRCSDLNLKELPTRICMGWDDKQYTDELLEAMVEMTTVTLFKYYKNIYTQKNEATFHTIMQQIVDGFAAQDAAMQNQAHPKPKIGLSPYTSESQQERSSRTGKAFIHSLLKHKTTADSYGGFFAKDTSGMSLEEYFTNQNQPIQKHSTVHAAKALDRTDKLLGAIKAYPGLFIVAQVGVYNTAANKAGILSAPARYLQKGLTEDCDDNPYAILVSAKW